MQKETCRIQFTSEDQVNISGEVLYQGKNIFSDTIGIFNKNKSENYLFPWLINLSKTIYKVPLSTAIDIKLIGEKNFFNPLLPIFQSMMNIVQNTRRFIATHQDISLQTSQFFGKLFLNLGDVPFLKALYHKAVTLDPLNTYYDTCDFLNDIQTNISKCESPQGLIKFIIKNNIKKIYTHNISYLMYFLNKHQIDLPSFLELIGIDLIIVDFDVYCEREGEYFIKKMLSTDKGPRFSIFPNIEAYWDKQLKINNVHYHPMPYKIEPVKSINFISPLSSEASYDILITSWARTKHILHFFKPILLFLSYVDFSKPFYDFQFLFHSMAYLLTKNTLLPLHIKMRYFTLLSEIYFHTNSFLKFEVLQNIQTKRKIHLYGQDDWLQFFPQYYQGQAEQNDLNKMLSEKPFLQILMNANYNYFENNPMFVRLLNSNNPYLGFSSVLRKDDLSGLDTLEFSNIEELNVKIENIQLLIQSEDYQKSRINLAHSMNRCVEDFYKEVLNPDTVSVQDKNSFEIMTDHYQVLFETQISESLKMNDEKIQECLSRIIREDFHHLDPETSPFMNRPYFQKLVTLYKQQEKP